jgi:peptide methionine sulfoxide reductase MsrA
LLNKKGFGEIVTELKPLDKFWQAEDYHQNYLTKNPNGYCPNRLCANTLLTGIFPLYLSSTFFLKATQYGQ